MKLLLTSRHTEITKKLSQYVRKRFGKWSTFLAPHTEVHVILSKEGYRQRVEVNAQDGRYTINGSQMTKDMFQSIDLLAEKINRQLVRQHEKLNSSKISLGTKHRGDTSLPDTSRPAASPLEPTIQLETVAGKPMTPEEAALQLQSLRQTYLVFEDAETNQLAVITKQKDGSFKLIVKE